VKHGLYIKYYPSGPKARVLNFENGRLNGTATFFSDTGQRTAEVEIKDGLRSSDWSYWDATGKREPIEPWLQKSLEGQMIGLQGGFGASPGPDTSDGVPDVAVAQRQAASKYRNCPNGMAAVPAGAFVLSELLPGEGSRAANVAPFCLDLTETTVEAFRGCVAARGCASVPATTWKPELPQFDRFCNGNQAGRSLHPINCIDWSQAAAFCAWAGKRLPTEDEWDWAARGGQQGRTYPWGEDAPGPQRLNACGHECVTMFKTDFGTDASAMFPGDDGWKETAPVESFPAGDGRWGIHDLAGNVLEWTASTDFAHPGERVSRGTSFGSSNPSSERKRTYFSYAPEFRNPYLGFRCAADRVGDSAASESPAPSPIAAEGPSPTESTAPRRQFGEDSQPRTYRNGRFGFVLEVPSSLEAKEPPTNGDGQRFVSRDGRAFVSVAGAPNVSLQASFETSLKDSAAKVTYKVAKSDWYVVSGFVGDSIFYNKAIARGDNLATMRVEFPKDEKAVYDPMVAALAKSFRFEGRSGP
jgi:formylglycine-generating enzyme required for sulfatase activity